MMPYKIAPDIEKRGQINAPGPTTWNRACIPSPRINSPSFANGIPYRLSPKHTYLVR
jgi:hypothetical protein